MGALVVGLSHRTAPLPMLESVSLDERACRALEARLCAGDYVAEAAVLSTCNRLEIYASTDGFHGALAEVGALLAEVTETGLDALTHHLYVHYDAAAVAHMFTLTAGLDSMAIGEQQILGQVRSAMRGSQEAGNLGSELLALMQQALRVGKRVHSETDLDSVSRSLVDAGLARAEQVLGALSGTQALVLGAGAMSGLAVATLSRAGVDKITVISRTQERADRLAHGVGGNARPMTELAQALAEADLVISCAGAPGHLVEADQAQAAARQRLGRAQMYLDLAMPRDLDPAIAEVDGVELVDLAVLGRELSGVGESQQPSAVAALPDDAAQAHVVVEQARQMVRDEVREHLARRVTATEVAPTVVALRGMAAAVVDSELERLRSRLSGRVDPAIQAELEQTVNRVVDKLLHAPTVRVKQLAANPDGPSYAQALRELFDLDPQRVAAVTQMNEPEAGGAR